MKTYPSPVVHGPSTFFKQLPPFPIPCSGRCEKWSVVHFSGSWRGIEEERGENGQRAMLWTDGQRAEQTAQGEGAISRKGQRYSLLHDTMAATYGGALLLGKSNLAPVGCRQ